MPEEVNHEELEQKLALAKSAMGANKYGEQRKARALELEKRRQDAKRAMEGLTHKQNREIKIEELEKQRSEARKAMESPEQRDKREKEERTEETKSKLLEQKHLAEELARQTAIKEKAEQLANEAIERDNRKKREETYLDHITKANSLVEKIKQKPEIELTSYHTLKTDTTEAIANENLSMASIALKEQTRNKKTDAINPNKKTSTLVVVILIVSLILSSLAVLGLLFLKPKTTTLSVLLNQIITTETQTKIDLSASNNPLNSLQEKINLAGTNETIDAFYFTTKTEEQEKIIPIQELFSILKLDLSTDFKYFIIDPYLIGVYHLGDKNIPFLILKTKSFEHTFAALLANEPAIATTINKLFSPQNSTTKIVQSFFVDKIINNIDTRISYDNSGQANFFYAFLNQNTLLISQSEGVITPIINRLQTNQQNTIHQ